MRQLLFLNFRVSFSIFDMTRIPFTLHIADAWQRWYNWLSFSSQKILWSEQSGKLCFLTTSHHNDNYHAMRASFGIIGHNKFVYSTIALSTVSDSCTSCTCRNHYGLRLRIYDVYEAELRSSQEIFQLLTLWVKNTEVITKSGVEVIVHFGA